MLKVKGACFLIFCILAMSMACTASEQSAEQRLRAYFKISSSAPLTREVIRAAILREIPVGSAEEVIYAYLKRANIGTDHLSSYSQSSERREIIVRIEYDTKEIDLVKKHYAVIFYLDEKRLLKDIEVKEWLTGL